MLKFSAIEIYNEAVKDLLSMDSGPLRLLDDPEVKCHNWTFKLSFYSCENEVLKLSLSERNGD